MCRLFGLRGHMCPEPATTTAGGLWLGSVRGLPIKFFNTREHENPFPALADEQRVSGNWTRGNTVFSSSRVPCPRLRGHVDWGGCGSWGRLKVKLPRGELGGFFSAEAGCHGHACVGMPNRYRSMLTQAWAWHPSFVLLRSTSHPSRHSYSLTTGLLSTPSFSISTSTVSPGLRNTGVSRAKPTPEGVPVKIRSPGERVHTPET